MIAPIAALVDAWHVSRADRKFSDPEPGAEHAVSIPQPAGTAFDILANGAVEIAIGEIGHGETEGNNRGEWIRCYCAPATDGHEWCAAFAGWCYEQASRRHAIPLPFKRSLGAKRLGKNVGAVGKLWTTNDASKARPGDLIVWHRGAAGSWSGHVGIIERIYDEHTICVIEGNSGAVVRRRHHSTKMERIAMFASVRP